MDKHNKLINFLIDVRNIVDSTETDLSWSKYNNLAGLLKEIDLYIEKARGRDELLIEDLKLFFAPTGSLQEISISNGWGEKLIELSILIDNL